MAADHAARRIPPDEIFNLATHAVGAALATAGLVWLVVRAEGPLAVTAFAVYGACLVALFLSSTAHHAVPATPESRQVMRRIDHVAIYLLIAGSYTPVCLLAVRPAWGIPLLSVVWGLAIVGIVLKIARPFTSRWVTIALYVALGWSAVVATAEIVRVFPGRAIALLAGGGVTYTVGAFVYAVKRPNLFPKYVGFHGVWHLFVLAAAGLHFAFIAGYVPSS